MTQPEALPKYDDFDTVRDYWIACAQYVDRARTALEAQGAPDLTRKERGELEIRRAWMDRNPFCPDHRDKVQGLSCRQCEIERLTKLVERASEGVSPEPAEFAKGDRSDRAGR